MQSVLNLHCILYFPFAVGCCSFLLARGYILSGVLFTINCNLRSEKEEFAELLFSNSFWDGYIHSLLNQTAFGHSGQSLPCVTLWSGISDLDWGTAYVT